MNFLSGLVLSVTGHTFSQFNTLHACMKACSSSRVSIIICAYNLSILPTCFIKSSLNSMLVIKGSALKCAALYLATPFSFNVSITSLDAGNVLSGSYLVSLLLYGKNIPPTPRIHIFKSSDHETGRINTPPSI